MSNPKGLDRNLIARRVARDIPAGSVINLGIGMPELVGNFLSSPDILVHTENGVIGSGPVLEDGDDADMDLINAGRRPVRLVRGGHFVDHADSFAIVRGRHLDITVLGAFEVSMHGDLANWSTGKPGQAPSPGGAMDLAVGARNVLVMMDLFARDGSPRLVDQCKLPITAAQVVKRVYTDQAVFEITATGVRVLELLEGWSLMSLQERLGFTLRTSAEGARPYTGT